MCKIDKIKSSLEEEIKLAILKTATLLEKGKYEKNKEQYLKKYGDKTRTMQDRKQRKYGKN